MTKRVPDEAKLRRGTLRPDRMRPSRPRPSGDVLRAPAGSDADVRAFYRRYAPQLAANGITAATDAASFELLAQTYATAAQAWRVVQREGFFRLDENGVQRRHPGLQVHRDATQTFARLAARFGLTPLDRERLDIEPPARDELAEAFTALMEARKHANDGR